MYKRMHLIMCEYGNLSYKMERDAVESLLQHTRDVYLNGVSSPLLVESVHVSLTESLQVQRLVHTTIKVIIYTNERSITNNMLKLKVINSEKQFSTLKEKAIREKGMLRNKTKQLPMKEKQPSYPVLHSYITVPRVWH